MIRLRVLRRMLSVLMMLAAFLVVGVSIPAGASAAVSLPGVPDCKDAPTPEVPGRGVEAFFQPAPNTSPVAVDPFATGSTSTIYEQYGYAGLRWNTYDTGCLTTGSSPEASVGTTVANWLMTIPKALVAATGALLGAAYEPSFLGVFDPLVTSVADAMRRSVFDQWAAFVLAALGFLIVWRARKSSLRTTASAIGWAMLVMVIAMALFKWPVAAGRAADSTITATMSTVTGALNQHDAQGKTSTGTIASANLHDALLYQVWLGGEFGDANSVAARKYGSQLFASQALSWSEASTLNQDPAAGQKIIDQKKAQFQAVAAAVKKEDPDAYEYLTGRRSDARIGFAVLSLIAVCCAVPFLFVAALLIVGALIITRFAVMMFPAIATMGMFPTMRKLVTGVGNTVAAAVLNALVFGISSAVLVKAYAVVMAPGSGLPSWLVVALLLLLTLVMSYTLKPFRRLTAMAGPGRNHFADATGALGAVTGKLGRAGGRVAGTALGAVVGDSVTDRRRTREGDDDSSPARRVEALGDDSLTLGGDANARPGSGVRPTSERGEARPGSGSGGFGSGGSRPSSGRAPARRPRDLLAADPGDVPPRAEAGRSTSRFSRSGGGPSRRSESSSVDGLAGWLRSPSPVLGGGSDTGPDDDGSLYRPTRREA